MLEFKAGKMSYDGKVLKPDSRKGSIRILMVSVNMLFICIFQGLGVFQGANACHCLIAWVHGWMARLGAPRRSLAHRASSPCRRRMA